jgi:hypothetical protein
MSKQIFSKIAKIGEEIRTIKVEFAIVDDLETAVKEVISLSSDFDVINKEVRDFKSDAAGFVGRYNRIADRGAQTLKGMQATLSRITQAQRELTQQSKELGINVKQIPAYNKSQQQAGILELKISYLKSELAQELKAAMPNL